MRWDSGIDFMIGVCRAPRTLCFRGWEQCASWTGASGTGI